MNQPATCPMAAAAAAHQPLEHAGMYEFFEDLRKKDVPIFYSPEIDYWVLTRRSDIIDVFRDTERFTASIATQPVFDWPQSVWDKLAQRGLKVEPTQVNSDGDRHAMIKAQTSKFFNIKRLSSYEPQIRALVKEHIEKMRGQPRVDLVDALTYELPAQVVFLLFGVSDFDPRKIKSWGDLRIQMMFGKLSEDEINKAADDLADFWDFTLNLLEDRKVNPQDDYPSMLAATLRQDDPPLTENLIRNLLFGVLLAGHETTTNAAGNLMIEMLRHPEAWRRIAEDPSLARNAVDEGLRFGSSVVAWRRRALEDVTIAGQTIRKGEKVLLSLGSANHDEAFFEQGEEFDIERPNARQHIAFGNGMHHCAGAPLARIELRVMLEELTQAFPDMALEEDQEFTFTPTITFRGPEKLWVRPNG